MDGEISTILPDFVVSIWEPKTVLDRLKADRILYRFIAAEQVRDGRSSRKIHKESKFNKWYITDNKSSKNPSSLQIFRCFPHFEDS